MVSESRESSPVRRATSGSISDRSLSPDFESDSIYRTAERRPSRRNYESDYDDPQLRRRYSMEYSRSKERQVQPSALVDSRRRQYERERNHRWGSREFEREDSYSDIEYQRRNRAVEPPVERHRDRERERGGGGGGPPAAAAAASSSSSGSGAGGGFDTTARLVSRHIGRHIPGEPTVIVQNMPGGGGLVAANHVFNAALRDGTVIGLFHEAQVMNQLTA